MPINCTIFKQKALESAKSLEIQDFHASDRWVGWWKKRFSVSFKTVSGDLNIFIESLEVVASKYV